MSSGHQKNDSSETQISVGGLRDIVSSSEHRMRVIKRDGSTEQVSLAKVERRIQKLSEDLDTIDPIVIAQKVCAQIYDGVRTSELDELAANLCTSMITEHPDYGILGSRIIISNNQKNTSPSFSETVELLYNNVGTNGEPNPLVSEELYQMTMKHKNKINDVINYERDFTYDYFAFKTLERGYLFKINGKIVERIQHMVMRVSLGLHIGDLAMALRSYEIMSQKYFTHATPTLYHAGTPLPQLLSCFLTKIPDSIAGIYNGIGKIAQISKWAGGIGTHIHDVRSKGSLIRGTNGKSDGIIPMLRVLNATARYVNQSGKRKGSFAMYLSPWHPDIMDFLDIRKNHGNEEERCRDLFTAMWISDLFMERVKSDSDWSLLDPDECPGLSDAIGDDFKALYEGYERDGKARKVVKAMDIWRKIIDSQIETGTPYMLYKDAANKKTNQSNLGTIKSSNLCVVPETLILTDEGYQRIDELAKYGTANIWNGIEFSESVVRKTGEDQEIIKVSTSDSCELECTPYHKFYIQTGYSWSGRKKDIIKSAHVKQIEAKDLKKGMKLIKCNYPIIKEGSTDFNYPYTAGFHTGDGTYTTPNQDAKPCNFSAKTGSAYCGRHQMYVTEDDTPTEKCKANSFEKFPFVSLYDDKKELIEHLEVRSSSNEEDSSGRINCQLPADLPEKFTVPMGCNLEIRLKWLAGLLDADGAVARNGTNESLQLASTDLDFLKKLKFMLNTMGCDPKISLLQKEGKRMLPDGKGGRKAYFCQTTWRILINSTDVYTLYLLGLETHRLKITGNKPQRCAKQFVKIVDVKNEGRISDTYCFNEPKRHAGIFNGMIAGNCTEIIEYSDENEYACCTLASIGLPRFVETAEDGTKYFNHEKLVDILDVVVDNLNKVIDLNYYPVPETKLSNTRHRPLGIGVQGLADTYAIMGYAFDSEEAMLLNREIFETLYYGSMKASVELAKKEGPYSTFEGSPLSQGKFQFDLWAEAAGEESLDIWEEVFGGESFQHPSNRWDWEALRQQVMEHGARNSLLIAPMPTASTSQILGNNECFEPFTSNIYARRTLAGDFALVNKHLARELLALGLWNPELKNMIIANGGSIQAIDGIPEEIKARYKTVWEIKQKVLINQAFARGPYICQSQSMNLFFEDVSFKKLSSAHFYGWKCGLKTGSYYIRTRAKVRPQQFTIDPSITQKVELEADAEAKMVCSLTNKAACEMCSG